MSTSERLNEAVRLTGVSAYGVGFADLVVRYGEVVVLAGANGAGKSTLSRILVGELAPGAGSVEVLGMVPVMDAMNGRIGYLVKDLETMGSLTSRDVLDICAAVRGCGTAYAHHLAARLGLEIDRPMGELSRGQLRRLGVVQALMHQPELLVLDDPVTELDDAARLVLPALLRDAADRGAAVLVTARSESGVEEYADRVVPVRRTADTSEPELDPEPTRQIVHETSVALETPRVSALQLAGAAATAGGMASGPNSFHRVSFADRSLVRTAPDRQSVDRHSGPWLGMCRRGRRARSPADESTWGRSATRSR